MNTFEDRTENHEVKGAATTFIVTNFYSAEDILGEIIPLPIVVFHLIRRLNRPELRKMCSGDLPLGQANPQVTGKIGLWGRFSRNMDVKERLPKWWTEAIIDERGCQIRSRGNEEVLTFKGGMYRHLGAGYSLYRLQF
jgi:hypothetical protein